MIFNPIEYFDKTVLEPGSGLLGTTLKLWYLVSVAVLSCTVTRSSRVLRIEHAKHTSLPMLVDTATGVKLHRE